MVAPRFVVELVAREPNTALLAVVQAGSKLDVLQGAAMSDMLQAAAMSDVLQAAAMSDVLQAAAMSDVLQAAAMSDVLQAAAMSDVLQAAAMSDVLGCSEPPDPLRLHPEAFVTSRPSPVSSSRPVRYPHAESQLLQVAPHIQQHRPPHWPSSEGQSFPSVYKATGVSRPRGRRQFPCRWGVLTPESHLSLTVLRHWSLRVHQRQHLRSWEQLPPDRLRLPQPAWIGRS